MDSVQEEFRGPYRVQLSRKKGWRMPENTVKVDRTTQWGNDFRVKDYPTAEDCVAMEDHDLDKFEVFHPTQYAEWIKPLVGKNVACWCKIGSPCHGDVLLRRAEEFAARPKKKRSPRAWNRRLLLVRFLALAAFQFAFHSFAHEIGAVLFLDQHGGDALECPRRETRLHVFRPLPCPCQLFSTFSHMRY